VKCCRPQSTQIGASFPKDFKEASTQTNKYSSGSYERDKRVAKRVFITYNYLKDNVTTNKEVFIE